MIKKFNKNIDPTKEISYNFIRKNMQTEIEKKTTYNRLRFINLALLVVCLIVYARVIDLTFDNFELPSFDFTSSQKTSPVSKKIRRDIIDRNGVKIVVSIPSLNLYVNSRRIENPDNTAKELVKIFPDLSYKDLMKIFSNKRSFTYIKRQVPIRLKTQIIAINDSGLKLENTYERAYPHDELFAHVIGNVDIDNNGLSGIEKGMNKIILQNNPSPIQLSLDVRIQELLRENLLKSLTTYGAKQASAILMNVRTGEILSLVSLPDYHPKNVGISLSDSKYNNHITFDVYEQGSVFKVFTSALAIDNGFADIDPIPVYDVGTPFKIGDRTIREEFIFQKYVKFSDILIKSSNIASAKVGLELGAKKQQDFYKKLGFFDRVKNIQVPELGNPIFKSASNWDDTITATSAYGYGLSITPLHTITGFNAMVNNGVFLNPTLLKVNNENVNTPEEIFLQNNKRVISLSTSKLLRKWLRSTITKDNENYIDSGDLKIGGKTGTSEKLVDGRYNSELLRTFFLVTFPIDNPKYSLLVMLDEPTHNAVGYNCRTSGCNVVPLTKEILKKLAVYMVLD